MILDAAHLILQLIEKLTFWPRITIETTYIKFMSTHPESRASK